MEQTNNFYEELQNSDWLGRNPEDYTYKKKGLSIGWEETLLSDDPYSRFILKVNSKKLDVKRKIMLTKQVCTNILSRMCPSNKRARIVFTEQFSSWQMKDTICVTLEPLSGKIKFPTFNHELDPVLGFCVHEIAHFLYTDEDYDRYLNKFKGSEAKIKQTIMNVLEDERIEQKVAETFRGYTGYIGKAKDYSFGKRLADEMRLNRVDDDVEINQLMQTFLYLLRYPKAVKEEYVNKFEKPLRKVTKILNPYPSDIGEMTVATDKIYNVFKDFYEENDDDDANGNSNDSGQSQQQQQAQSQTEDSESSVSMGMGKGQKSKANKDNTDNKDQDQDQNKDKDEQGDDQNDPQNEQDKDKGDGGQNGEEDNENEEADKKDGSNGGGSDVENEEEEKTDGSGGSGEDTDEGDENESEDDGDGSGEDDKDESSDGNGNDTENKPSLEDALSGLLEAIQSAEPKTGNADEVAQMIKGDYSVPKILDEVSSYDNSQVTERTSFSHIYPSTENLNTSEMQVIFQDAKNLHTSENHYDRALQEVRTYASSLRAKIQQLNRNQTMTTRGLSEGDFDDVMLVDAIIGSKNVYKEEHQILNRGASIGLLIDESGSMGWGGRWFEAMKIAVMFERALEGVNNVDFYCYGHTTGSSFNSGGSYGEDATLINVYYEGRKNSDRKILGKIHNHNTNRDGHAILETIGRMRQKVDKKLPIILFMISDGEPSATVPNGYNGRSFTKKAVNTVEKFSNATVLHIAIEPNIPSEEMFNHYIKLTDHATLVRDLGNVLKKIMIKQQQAVIL